MSANERQICSDSRTFKARAAEFGWNPNSAIAARTFLSVAGLASVPFITRETEATETPAL